MTEKQLIDLGLSKGERNVIYTIKSFGKHCYPSIKTLSKNADICEKTLRKYLKALTDKGYLIIKTRNTEKGSQITNEYILNLPRIEKPTLKEKLVELKEAVTEKAKEPTPLVKNTTQEYINKSYKYKSKSKKTTDRPRLEELKTFEELEQEPSYINSIDKDTMQMIKRVMYSLVMSKQEEYILNHKPVSKKALIDKLKSLCCQDIKKLVNAITGKQIKSQMSYTLNALYNYNKDQDNKTKTNNSKWYSFEQRTDYDFELLERIGARV